MVTSTKEAVTGPASPTRPASRGTGRRRPAPKIITDAIHLNSLGSPTGYLSHADFAGSDGGMGRPGVLLAPDQRPQLPARALKPDSAARSRPGTAGSPVECGSPLATKPVVGLSQVSTSNCTISTDAVSTSEIRTKVFRIGAPLLRSTIPVALGGVKDTKRSHHKAPANRGNGAEDGSDEEASDVETVLSLSDVAVEDQGAISVTLDFPC